MTKIGKGMSWTAWQEFWAFTSSGKYVWFHPERHWYRLELRVQLGSVLTHADSYLSFRLINLWNFQFLAVILHSSPSSASHITISLKMPKNEQMNELMNKYMNYNEFYVILLGFSMHAIYCIYMQLIIIQWISVWIRKEDTAWLLWLA